MDINLLTAIIGLTAGAISGTVASLTAPWVGWSIEKRKIKLENRRKTLEQWRNCIKEDFDPQKFRETIEFSQMQKLISKGIEKELNPADFIKGEPVITLRSPIGRDNLRDRLLKEISEIEQKWNLL
jgi:gas vesicle protein